MKPKVGELCQLFFGASERIPAPRTAPEEHAGRAPRGRGGRAPPAYPPRATTETRCVLISHLYGKYANKVKAGAEKHYHSSVAVSWLPERLLLLQQRRAPWAAPQARCSRRPRRAPTPPPRRHYMSLRNDCPRDGRAGRGLRMVRGVRLKPAASTRSTWGRRGTTAAPEYADIVKLYFAEVNAAIGGKLGALVNDAEAHMQMYCGTDRGGHATTPTVIEMTRKLCRNFGWLLIPKPRPTGSPLRGHAHRRRLRARTYSCHLRRARPPHASSGVDRVRPLPHDGGRRRRRARVRRRGRPPGHDHGQRLAAPPRSLRFRRATARRRPRRRRGAGPRRPRRRPLPLGAPQRLSWVPRAQRIGPQATRGTA